MHLILHQIAVTLVLLLLIGNFIMLILEKKGFWKSTWLEKIYKCKNIWQWGKFVLKQHNHGYTTTSGQRRVFEGDAPDITIGQDYNTGSASNPYDGDISSIWIFQNDLDESPDYYSYRSLAQHHIAFGIVQKLNMDIKILNNRGIDYERLCRKKKDKKWSVAKVKVVDSPAVSEVKDDKGVVVRQAQAEISHEVVKLNKKRWDAETGKAVADESMQVDEVYCDNHH